MSTFIRSFKLTLGRFRWEILAFWIFSIGLVAATGTGLLEQPLIRDSNHPFHKAPDWGKLEILAACWLILRLMFSEPVFRTQGGWRTRPISRDVAILTPYVVLAMALLPALLVRLVFIAARVTPDATLWWQLFRDYFFWGMVSLGMFALVMRITGSLLRGRRQSLAKKVLFGAMALLATGAWFHPKTMRILSSRSYSYSYPSQSQDFSYGDLLPGLHEVLPADAQLLDTGGAPYQKEVPHMREMLRFTPTQGGVIRGAGVKVEITRVQPVGNRLEVEMNVDAIEHQTLKDVFYSAMLLRFPGEIYSFRQRLRDDRANRYPLPCFPLNGVTVRGSFVAPTLDVEWDKLLPGLELIIYRRDESMPLITDYDVKVLKTMNAPRPAPPPLPPGVKGEVTAVFRDLDAPNDWYGKKRESGRIHGAKIPHEGLPEVLAWHPWSYSAWGDFVKPFLLKHAVESDKRTLLERMITEPRLGEVFVQKEGWRADAMPLMIRFAKERLPMDATMMKALLEERDPAIASDLSALAARLDRGVEALEPLLRNYPGIDWQAFVHEGWIRRKYGLHDPLHPFDLWAAQAGDASAFRCIGEKAALGETDYKERLESLLKEKHEDPVGFVRENLETIRFDADSGKWGL